MFQFSYYTKEIAKYWTDPDTGLRSRYGVFSNHWRGDCELVTGGFSLAEDVGYKNFDYDELEVTGLRVREGVVSGRLLRQSELTATGFAGVESDDGGLTGDYVSRDAES